jgi:hypothetical protein
MERGGPAWNERRDSPFRPVCAWSATDKYGLPMRSIFPRTLFFTMSSNDNQHLDVCQNIEAVIKRQYDLNPQLTDALCVFALDNVKIAIKQRFGFARNEQVTGSPPVQNLINGLTELGLARIEKINALTLKEYVACLEKIKKSVIRHSSDGSRGYYEFIKNYLP